MLLVFQTVRLITLVMLKIDRYALQFFENDWLMCAQHTIIIRPNIILKNK